MDRVPAPLVVQLIIVSTFLPEMFSFFVAGLRLTVTRVIFLSLPPVLIWRLSRQIAAGRYRFVISDLLVTLSSIWMFLSTMVVQDIEMALAHTGPIVLEFFVAYWAMRLLLSRHGQALSVASFLCAVLAVVALLGILDPLTDQYVVHHLANALTDYGKPLPPGLERRLGLLRALGPIEHPILFGLACGIGTLLAAWVGVRARGLKVAACAAGTFFSFSAAPLLGVALGIALMLYDRLLARVPGRWFTVFAVAGIGALSLFLLHPAPFGFIVRHLLLFEAGSGYDRLVQWQITGTFLLKTSPWFGYGMEPLPEYLRQEMFSTSGSIDSLWLNMALYCGIPGSTLIGLSVISTMSLSTRSRGARLQPAEAKLGTVLNVALIVFVFVGFTAHFWGSEWILMALLMGLRAHLGALSRVAPPPQARTSATDTAARPRVAVNLGRPPLLPAT